jgi:hypothetical protein
MKTIYRPETAAEFVGAMPGRPKPPTTAPGEAPVISGKLYRTAQGQWRFDGNATIDHLKADEIEAAIGGALGIEFECDPVVIKRQPLGANNLHALANNIASGANPTVPY